MIFHEVYGAYYNCVAKILAIAVQRPVTKQDLFECISQTAFSESSVAIIDALEHQTWNLLLPDGTTPIQHPPSMPLTSLQKRWLKAMLMDKRIQLFIPDITPYLEQLADVEPLFTAEQYCIFDQYTDGDPYTDQNYINNFHLILDALTEKYPLKIIMKNRSGLYNPMYVLPEYLEYSEKDDKFRLIASDGRQGKTINLGRIQSCEKYSGKPLCFDGKQIPEQSIVVLEITDERNALERVLLHFAHFEKTVRQTTENQYQVEIQYNRDDESELVIRILSFGPMVEVKAPNTFRQLIAERLRKQKSCGIF